MHADNTIERQAWTWPIIDLLEQDHGQRTRCRNVGSTSTRDEGAGGHVPVACFPDRDIVCSCTGKRKTSDPEQD